HTTLDDAALRIWEAEADVALLPLSVPPGTVISADKTSIHIATGDGVLRITRLQPSGKKPMTAADYRNARHVDGVRFG
ncbi:MAG: methionyl-tRNA formyltransferase, partial [Chromatium okenii]|nr:methionyl-tRNA formyltransferase [Chromatium okenii]